MSIQIITGFSLNSIEPIDTRIVASGSTGRDAIPYKYQGLRVFDLSNNRPYVYIGATWSVEVSDQVIGTTGTIGKFTSSNTISDSDVYQVNSGLTSSFGIGTSNPLGFVQMGNSSPSTGHSLPFVIHKSGASSGLYAGSTVLGHNWYYTSSNQYFNNSLGSSNLVFGYYGDITIQNKAGAGSIINSLYISPLGKVGIGTGFGISSPPSQSLSVSGTVSATGFVGSGAGLTNISPSSISNQNLLSAGSSVTASNVVVTNVITNASHYPTFVSSGSSTSIKTNTSGLSYNPSTNILNTGLINHIGGTLSTTAGGKVNLLNLSSIASTVGNISYLEFSSVRNTTDTSWLSSGYRIQAKVDSTYMGYIQFNGTGNDYGISFGTGTTDATSNAYERMRISSAGLLTVSGSMKHVSPTFSSHGSFVVGAGSSVTTPLTITSATYDRVIYMYGSNNSNTYYNSAGWLEITINVGAQQVYSSFFGSDNDFRPSFGYSYILPAGLASTIGLSKNSLVWNTGSGPTIYANSLKFGI
jgi:hypothetical protein